MRRIAIGFLLIALAVPLCARNLRRLSRMTAGNPAALTITSVDPELPTCLLAQLKARALTRRSVPRGQGAHASTITDSVSARAFIIPAAGSVAGGGGTLFFRSDVTLVNYRSTPQQVLAGLWAIGSSNSLAPSNYKSVTLQPNTYVTIQDFIVNALGKSNALGALIFIPYTGTTLDPSGAIDGFSRIYTKQPGSTGSVSQPFDAVDPDTLSAQLIDEGVALGLRQDADFRTNFGIVNVDASDHVFKLTFAGEKMTTTQTLTVKAYGMIQQAIPAGDYGALQIIYQ